MSWVGKTTPSRIDELTNELRYVREYISQLPSNIGSIGADNAGFGRRTASNSVGPVKGLWSFHPIFARRHHEETLTGFLGETNPPIFLNALEVRAASHIVTPNTFETLMAIRQLVTATDDGQILFLTAHDDETLRLMPGNLNTNGVLVIKDVAVDFVPDEVVTGLSSGATCEVDFIQNNNEPSVLPAGEKKIWFRNLSGSFQSNEDISGSIAGSAKAKNPQTKDTAGNINIAENIDIDENQELLLKWNVNAPIPTSPEGSWIIVGGADITVIGGGGTGITFPILYPTDDKGDRDGTSTLAIDLSVATAHVTRFKLVGSTPITQLISFTNPPIVGESIAYYITVEQDDNGGHTLDFSDTINNIPLIQTGANRLTTIGFITTDGGVTFDTFVFGQTLGDNLGNHEATEDLKMNTFDVIDVDVLRYADPNLPGADGVIGFGVFGSSTDVVPIFSNIFGLLPAGEVLKWNIPESEAGIPRRYQWEVDLEPVMALNVGVNRNFVGLDMLGKGTIDNTQGISFRQFDLVAGTAIATIKPVSLEMSYETGYGSGVGSFHGFRVGIPLFPQFEVREDVLRANVDLDMITNNIFEIDQARFSAVGGFNSLGDHGERLIAGGNSGIQMNIPRLSQNQAGFNIFFENAAKDDSDLEYEFFRDGLFMHKNTVNDTLGIFFTNGTSILDLGDGDMLQTIGIRPGSEDPQTMKFVAKDRVGPTSYVDRDVFEITGQEFFTGGGFKMFTDINMQTQNINNIDVLKFAVDSGAFLPTDYAIAARFSDTELMFNVPSQRDYLFLNNGNPIATLDPTGFTLLANAEEPNASLNPSMGAKEFFLFDTHTGGDPGIDGQIRLIDNGGSIDVVVATGGGLVNLSNLTAGIGHIIQDEGIVENQRANLNFVGTGVDVEDDPANNRTNVIIDAGVGGGATSLDELSDVIITLPQNADEGLFFSGISGQYENTKIKSQNLQAGVFSNIEGIGVQTQELDMGGFNIINSPGGFATSFIGFDADDNLRMNDLDILRVRNIDFDDPASNIQGLVGLNFFFGTDGIFSGPNDLFYSTISRHRFEQGGLTVLDLAGNAVRPIELRFDQLTNRTGNTNQIFRETFGMSFGTPSNGVFQWYGGNSVIASLQDIGTGGSFSADLINVGASLFFSDSGPSQSLGLMSRDGDDITVLTSNGLKNFKDIGSGGVGNFVTLDTFQTVAAGKTWEGTQTFIGPSFSVTSPNIFIGDEAGDNVFIQGTIGSPLKGGSGLIIDGDTSAIHEFRFGGTGKFLFTNISAVFNEQLSMGFNKIINLQEPTVSSDAATKNYVDIQGSGVTEGQAFVNWLGNHTFNGSFTTIGNSTSDTLTVNARINGGLIPISTGQNIGSTSLTWDVFAKTFRFGNGTLVDAISTSAGAFGVTELMTANAIQAAISAFGGGVTEGQSTVNWTGNHTFNGSFTVIGNSTSDTLQVNARVSSSLIPIGSPSLGSSGNQWQNLFVTGTAEIDTLHLASGSFVSDIANFSAAFGSGQLMTANAIQQAIANAGGGDFVTRTGPQQTVTSTKIFTSSASRFSSNLEIDGTLNHDGSLVGFRGASPSSSQAIPFASSAGSTATQLASLRAQGNTIRAVLITQGLAKF